MDEAGAVHKLGVVQSMDEAGAACNLEGSPSMDERVAVRGRRGRGLP